MEEGEVGLITLQIGGFRQNFETFLTKSENRYVRKLFTYNRPHVKDKVCERMML